MKYVITTAEDRAKAFPDSFVVGPLEIRQRLRLGTVARLVFSKPEPDSRGRTRSERMWVKITKILVCSEIRNVTYVGELVSESYAFDIEPGEVVSFGPEHVCEWAVEVP